MIKRKIAVHVPTKHDWEHVVGSLLGGGAQMVWW